MSNTTDFIVHDKQDNVGVVVIEKTPENQECTGWVMEDDSTIKIKANTSIPLGHKIALQDFKTGDTIIKYGYDIGKVVQDIKKGDHVHVHNVKTKKW
jgi:(2R)-sulfolactate sulfo-lyase subunit alpha